MAHRLSSRFGFEDLELLILIIEAVRSNARRRQT